MQFTLDVQGLMCPPKLCSDISGFLHEVPALYDREPYRKADLPSILGNDSHSVTSATLLAKYWECQFK